VRFSHSVFAIPFAGIMLLVVMRNYAVSWMQLGLLLLCVVSARFAAMAFNRIVDARIDARNERTKNREIPAGRVTPREAWLLVLTASLVFTAASFGLGAHCGLLSVPVLGVLLGYSYVKRFSSLCHVVLGVALACAPGGVWYALTATWSWQPIPLMVSVMLWVAGFDILYACQDAEFDRTHGLRSVPSMLGIPVARGIAIVLHILCVCFLAVFGHSFGLGGWFWCGAGLFAALIASQHVVVHRHGLESIDQIFFVRNGLASVVLLMFVLADQVTFYSER
jgi:4-hydroxybenzoate polyprenyltransferase